METNNTDSKYQLNAMKWLFELEVLNNPQVINTIKFNILAVSNSIKETELLIFRENKAILVLIKLNWFGRTFHKNQIISDIHEQLRLLLPSFNFRVTEDPKIMELAVAQVKHAVSGGANA
jgi:hypothetical protein